MDSLNETENEPVTASGEPADVASGVVDPRTVATITPEGFGGSRNPPLVQAESLRPQMIEMQTFSGNRIFRLTYPLI